MDRANELEYITNGLFTATINYFMSEHNYIGTDSFSDVLLQIKELNDELIKARRDMDKTGTEYPGY